MPADLAQFRDRLKVARRYLAGRVAEDDDPSRKIPDTGWMRILASLQTCLEAVEAIDRARLGETRERAHCHVNHAVGRFDSMGFKSVRGSSLHPK